MSTPAKPRLISIVGPTAVGKTSVAIEIARKLKTEIISSDSRQFFKELQLGTAKPSSDELSLVPHHFISHLSIKESYNAGMFERDAISLLNQLFKVHHQVIMVGGSGLYCQAVWKGIDYMPEVDITIRTELNDLFKKDGINPLREELRRLDPDYYEIVDTNNHVRLIRALEVIRSTGKKYSSFRTDSGVVEQRNFENLIIGLEMDRELLYQRIDTRMDQMIINGLFEEAKHFFPFRELNALQTVGYQEIFGYLEGLYPYEEAVRLLKRNSRHYAKRQLTWFKKNKSIKWVNMDQPSDGLSQIFGLIDA